MRTVIDRDFNPRHLFLGDVDGYGNDRMISNGLARTIVGGAGNDDINPGINLSMNPRDMIVVYGDFALDGFGSGPYAPKGIDWAKLFGDDDTIHFGANIQAKSGGGSDDYIVHGFFKELDEGGRAAFANWFNPWEGDRLIVAHDRGIKVSDIDVFRYFEGRDGTKYVSIKDMTLEFYSAGTVKYSAVHLGFNDDFRGGEHKEVIIAYDGRTGQWTDDVREMIADAADGSSELRSSWFGPDFIL